METKQTAVYWLEDKIINYDLNQGMAQMRKYIFQAKQMEKEQMDKVSQDWWNEGASYMYDGKREYDSFEQYYNETYGN
jgi:hypothetical protein